MMCMWLCKSVRMWACVLARARYFRMNFHTCHIHVAHNYVLYFHLLSVGSQQNILSSQCDRLAAKGASVYMYHKILACQSSCGFCNGMCIIYDVCAHTNTNTHIQHTLHTLTRKYEKTQFQWKTMWLRRMALKATINSWVFGMCFIYEAWWNIFETCMKQKKTKK